MSQRLFIHRRGHERGDESNPKLPSCVPDYLASGTFPRRGFCRDVKHLSKLWDGLGKQFKALPPKLKPSVDTYTGDVAARMRNVRDYSLTNGVPGDGHNGDGSRRGHQREGHGSTGYGN